MRKLTRLLMVVFLLSSASTGWAQQAVLDVGTVSGVPGATVSVPVDVITDQSIAALQFDLSFAPALVTPTGATLGAAAGNHVIASAVVSGRYRVVIYSPTNAPLASARLANVSFTIAAGASPQTVPIGIQSVVLSTAAAVQIPTTSLDPGSISVLPPAVPSLTIGNTQTSGPNPATAAGQVLGYTVVVTNTGSVSHTGVNVTDTLPSGSAAVLTGPVESVTTNGVLDVAETWTYTTSYTVTQANIDAGTALVNTARVITTQVPGPTQAIATTPITQSPALTIVKTRTSGPNSVTAAGQVLGYTIVVTNTGNLSQTGVIVTDTLPDGSAGVLPAPIQSITANAILEVGETWTYTISYTVTQANYLAGAALVNTAQVITTQVPGPTQSSASTPIALGATLSIVKTQTSGPNPAIQAGQVLGYTIVVSNTGNLSQTGVNVTDTLPNGSAGVLAGPVESVAANGVLDVAETWTYTTSYTVTQANVDAGTTLVNTARVVTAQVPGPTQNTASTQIATPVYFDNEFEGTPTSPWNFEKRRSNLLVELVPGGDAGTGTLLVGVAEGGMEAFRLELREGSQGLQVRAIAVNGAAPWSSRWAAIERGRSLQLYWWSEQPPGASNGGLRLWANGELLVEMTTARNAGVRLIGLRGVGPDGVASEPLANGQIQSLRIVEGGR